MILRSVGFLMFSKKFDFFKKMSAMVVAGIIAFLSVVYFIWSLIFSEVENKNSYQGAAVEVVLVKKRLVSRKVIREGRLQPENSVEIKPQTQGVITKINFKGGELVKKGDVLVELDSELATAQLKEAQAKLVLAEHEYKIAEKLAKSNSGSKVEAAKKKASFKVAEANVEKSKYQVKHTKILVPFEGYVSLRNSNKISVGSLVDRNHTILTVNDNDPMVIDFRIPEKEAGKIYKGQKIDIAVDSFLHKKFKAKIVEISPRIDNASGLAIRGHVENSLGVLKPGMSCKVTLSVDQDENALVVPEDAIETIGNENFIFRVSKSVQGKFAEQIKVKVGILVYGDRVIYSKQIKEGDHVIVVGNVKISNGYPVREINLKQIGVEEEKAPKKS